MRRRGRAGFSLVEVVVALGIAVFALLTMLALLPMGMTANHMSAEELHAFNILSLLNADLRNTHPLLQSSLQPSFAGQSSLPFVLSLELPYAYQKSTGTLVFNTIPPVSGPGATVPAGPLAGSPPPCSVGVDAFDNVVALGSVPPEPYEASVIYIVVPTTAPVVTPIHARLIVNWPALPANAAISDLTSGKVKGYVEAYVTFPAP